MLIVGQRQPWAKSSVVFDVVDLNGLDGVRGFEPEDS